MAPPRSLPGSTQGLGPGGADDPELPEEDPRFRMMRRLVVWLLIVMIVGLTSITVALVSRLMNPGPVIAGLAPTERIEAAEATPDRVTLTVVDQESGRQRVVVLSGQTFRPLREIQDRAGDR